MKKRGREKSRKRLLLKEGVSTALPVMLLKNSVLGIILAVAGILGATFWVTPVVYRSVCLRCRRVCLLRLMCLIPSLRWLCLVKP